MLYTVFILSNQNSNFFAIMENVTLYIWRSEDGKESEPVDQDTLITLAKQGVITPHCSVRNQFLPNWARATDYDFLEEFLRPVVQKERDAKENTFGKRLKRRIFLEAENTLDMDGRLGKTSPELAPAAPLFFRLMALLFDLVLLAIWTIALFFVCAFLFARGILNADNAFYVGFGVWWFTLVLYFTVCMSAFTQTFGQRCWGIFLIRKDGYPHGVGRAFFYFVFLLTLGIFTPFAIFGVGRSLQEIFTSTRMVRSISEGKKRD